MAALRGGGARKVRLLLEGSHMWRRKVREIVEIIALCKSQSPRECERMTCSRQFELIPAFIFSEVLASG